MIDIDRGPYHKSVFGVGYRGVGEYRVSTQGKHTAGYRTWRAILCRAYDTAYQNKQPTYKGCYVCEDWHNFQNFADWYYKQPNNSTKGFAIDKDLIVLGNKVYGPKECSLVPQAINNLLTDHRNKRGALPQGVSTSGSKYTAQISINGKIKHLGSHKTIDEAYRSYKSAKEYYVKEQAEKYKGLLHHKVYENLMNYSLEDLEVSVGR